MTFVVDLRLNDRGSIAAVGIASMGLDLGTLPVYSILYTFAPFENPLARIGIWLGGGLEKKKN
jgi:hypothetical protein